RPGVYREQLLIPTNINDLKNETPIVFEASEKGKVIVSGSDVWGDWKLQQVNDAKVYAHEWPYTWGMASVPQSIPSNYQTSFKEKPLIKRREMIFVNGVLMKQLSSLDSLTTGSFFVDEEKKMVFLSPPAGVDLMNAKVEVAVRPSVLFADFAKNVSFRGLIFEHANTSLNPDYYNPGNGYQNTNRINNSSQILFEDVQFVWNNTNGVALISSSHITLRRTVANHNGLGGMTGFKLKNILFEDTETSENNWRGDMSDYRDWGVAGLKFLAVHTGVFRRHVARNNLTRGFWLDFDNSDIVIDSCNFTANKADGIFLEANSGPIKMIETKISGNEGPGLLTSAAHNLTLE
ncbi:MAG: right-handed parallel beta-helix repeat-containing protein, partial [Pyrinomonadaceae bacterium]